MKKILTRSLIVIMFVLMPFCLVTAGCKLFKDLKTPTQAEMFAKVREFMIAEKAYTGDYTSKLWYYDIEDEEELLKLQNVATYNKSERKFAERSYEYNENNNQLEEVMSSFYFEENDKCISYKYEEGKVDYFNVGEDYFGYFAVYIDEIYNYLMTFDNNDKTINDYANGYVKKLGAFSDKDNIKTESSISIENGKYVINLKLMVTREGIEAEGVSKSKIIIDTNSKVVEEEVSVISTLFTDDGPVVVTNSKFKAIYAHEFNKSIEMTAVEKSTMTNIQKAKSTIHYHIDGDYFTSGLETVYGTEITLSNKKRDNTTRSIWYMDEACTIPCTITTQPSYDLDLYAKSTPNNGYYLLIEGEDFGTEDEWVYDVKVIPIENNMISDYLYYVDSREYVYDYEAEDDWDWFDGEGYYTITYRYKVFINGVETDSYSYHFVSGNTYKIEQILDSVDGFKLSN